MSARMPFGRYKNVLIADLDDGYLTWLHDHVELREPLRTAVHMEFESRFTMPDPNASLPSDVRQMGLELISAGFRKLAMEHHPDHGGETRTMQLVNRAADFLRHALRST